MSRIKRRISQFFRRRQGAAAVEFALVIPLLLLLVFGGIDFGHAFYIKHILINASREGARYASRYQTDSSGNHLIPNNLNPSIQNFILNTSAQNGNKGGCALKSMLPTDANPAVTPAGNGYTSGIAGQDLTITVTARKRWFVIGVLVPILGSYKDLSVTTDMKVE